MVCLIKSKYKAELKHYADILGSEEAAYYVLAANNGFTLDKTPQGYPSDLYNFLLEVGGNEKQAVLSKAMAYTPQFIEENGNWIESGKGEPSAYLLNNGERFTDGKSLSDVLNDSGRYVEECSALEDANILDHEMIISSGIGHARDEFAEKYLTHWLETHKDASQFEKNMHKMSAEQTWTKNKISELMSKVREVFGDRFKLKSKIVDGRVVFYSDNKDEMTQLRVEFVNSLTDSSYFNQDGTEKQGLFFDKSLTDGTYDLILLALDNGDPTTIIHELSHSYIRRFWNSEPVQRALRVIDAESVGRLTSKDLEEALAETITDKVMNKKSSRFLNAFRKVMHAITFGLAFKDRREIRDLITAYFILNRDLSTQQASQISYEMFHGPMSQSRHSVTEQSAFDQIVFGLKRKLRSLEATDAPVSQILRTKQNLQRIQQRNSQTSSDVEDTISDFLNLAIDEIAEAERLLSTVLHNGIDTMDLRQFMEMKANVISYYQTMLYNHISPLVENNAASYIAPGSLLYDQFSQIYAIVQRISGIYDNVLSRYVDNEIEKFVEATVDVGDRARITENMKYWVRNEINDGRLQVGELFFGGTTSSRSPIVRMIEYMVSDSNTKVRIETNSLGHKLKDLYDKCKPAVSFTDFMRTFVEKDKKGKSTGYFLRDINYGQFYDDRDEFIKKLDEKYNVIITTDENGNEERSWASDADWRNYQDELDDWYGTHAHRKYSAEYYKDRRKYLSRDTIESLDAINDRINVILNKCTDPVTKIPYTFELSVEDRQELRKLNQDKEQLASPYIITQDLQGNIVNIQEKVGDAKRMAQELSDWGKAKQKLISYETDLAKFKRVEQYVLNKYGASSIQMARFKEDYLLHEINHLLWDEIGTTGYSDPRIQKEVNDLKAKKASIMRVCYQGKKGYIQPDLSKLNDKAFEELKKIDQRLSQLGNDPSMFVQTGMQNFKDIFFLRPVLHQQTGVEYLTYLEQQASNQSSYNANSLQQFYNKYYYRNAKGELKPLSVFFYVSPIKSTTILSNGTAVQSIVDTPTGRFQDVSATSYYADQDYDPSLKISIQPSRSEYDNSEEYNKVMSDTNKKAFYDALIEAMDEAYKKLPHYHEFAKYLMPQIANKELGRIAGGWRDIYGGLKGIAAIDDDKEINPSQTLRPDGTPVQLIPIRWNKRRKDINISNDVLYTVVAFGKMASEYQEKRRIQPVLEAIIQESRNNPVAGKQSEQTKKLEDYADTNLYGNYKKPLTKDRFGDKAGDAERRVSQVAEGVLKLAHAKLMSKNFRAIAKNLLDSTFTLFAEIGGGKHFVFKDFIMGLHYAFKDIAKAGMAIGNPNTRSKLAAAMQFNGAAETVDELFQHQNNSAIVRFFKKFFCMGEYTLIDYLIKGVITGMTYHHHRLIVNPRTGKREFLTQDQARYAYIAAGKSAKEGSKAWRSSNITLWDAYDIDDKGDFKLVRFKDTIRPTDTNGKVSTKIETRVSGIIRERGSVTNGILDSANKGNLARTYAGMALMQMRGWMVSHAYDYFKDGTDFSEYKEQYDAKLKNNKAVKESEDFTYRGQYNFETGTIERGTIRGLFKALGRMFGAMPLLNKLVKTNKLTRNEKYQIRRLTFVMVGLALSILSTVWFGKKVEDDPDSDLAWAMYAISVAATSERATTIPYVQAATAIDVVRSPLIAIAWFKDMPAVLDAIGDSYEAATYDMYTASTYPDYNKTITSGSYKNMQNWQRDALKASSVLYPYINANNVVKNIRKESSRSSANYYRDIWPTGVLTYKPRINETQNDEPILNQIVNVLGRSGQQ